MSQKMTFYSYIYYHIYSSFYSLMKSKNCYMECNCSSLQFFQFLCSFQIVTVAWWIFETINNCVLPGLVDFFSYLPSFYSFQSIKLQHLIIIYWRRNVKFMKMFLSFFDIRVDFNTFKIYEKILISSIVWWNIAI